VRSEPAPKMIRTGEWGTASAIVTTWFWKRAWCAERAARGALHLDGTSAGRERQPPRQRDREVSQAGLELAGLHGHRQGRLQHRARHRGCHPWPPLDAQLNLTAP